MNYGSSRVYGVSLSYLLANGDRSFSYYEIPADNEYEAMHELMRMRQPISIVGEELVDLYEERNKILKSMGDTK